MVLIYLLSLGVVAAVIMAGGLVCRKLDYGNESWRKLTHSTHGVYIGVLPFFTSIRYVIITEVLFLLAMMISRYVHEHYDRKSAFIHYLGAMYRVSRQSYGEFFFPLGILAAALLADSIWIYLAATLVLGVADAAAAVVGKRFGKHPYKIFGQNKSLQGSLAFFGVALVVLLSVMHFGQLDPGFPVVLVAVALSAILTFVENAGVYGSDNLLLPVATVLALSVVV